MLVGVIILIIDIALSIALHTTSVFLIINKLKISKLIAAFTLGFLVYAFYTEKFLVFALYLISLRILDKLLYIMKR